MPLNDPVTSLLSVGSLEGVSVRLVARCKAAKIGEGEVCMLEAGDQARIKKRNLSVVGKVTR